MARFAHAEAALRAVFPDSPIATTADPVGLVHILEATLGAGKDAWPVSAVRKLWDALWEGRARRRISQPHEARWLNSCGFLLRPGFGHELDEWRLQQLWKLISEGVGFTRAIQCRVEWWSMWRRVAGGLSRAQQTELYNQTAVWLLPRLKSRTKNRRSAVGPQELREYWQVVASCERLSAKAKAELGGVLLPTVAKSKATEAEIWALGRLGARAPVYGPLNCVVARETVEAWVGELLQRDWREAGQYRLHPRTARSLRRRPRAGPRRKSAHSTSGPSSYASGGSACGATCYGARSSRVPGANSHPRRFTPCRPASTLIEIRRASARLINPGRDSRLLLEIGLSAPLFVTPSRVVPNPLRFHILVILGQPAPQ